LENLFCQIPNQDGEHKFPSSATTIYTQLHPHDLNHDMGGISELHSYLTKFYQVDMDVVNGNVSQIVPPSLSAGQIHEGLKSNNSNTSAGFLNQFYSTSAEESTTILTQREEYLRLRKDHRNVAKKWVVFSEQGNNGLDSSPMVEEDIETTSPQNANKTSISADLNITTPFYHPDRLYRFSHALISDFGASRTLFDTIPGQINSKNQTAQQPQAELLIGHSGTMQYSSPELLLSFGIGLLNKSPNHTINTQEDKANNINNDQKLPKSRLDCLKSVLPQMYSHITSSSETLPNISSLFTQKQQPCPPKGITDPPKNKSQWNLSSLLLLNSYQQQLQTTESLIQQDIWSLGILLYVLAYNHFPYSPANGNDDDLTGQILSLSELFTPDDYGSEVDVVNSTGNKGSSAGTNGDSRSLKLYFPSYILQTPSRISYSTAPMMVTQRSLSIQALIKFILQPNPALRPTIFEIITHPIVQAHDFASRLNDYRKNGM
jgi:hypothetical protein